MSKKFFLGSTLGILITVTSFSKKIIFEGLPATNNLEEIKNEKLLIEVLENLPAVENFTFLPNSTIKVKLKPILVDVDINSQSPFISFEVKRILGLREFYRYPTEQLLRSKEFVKFYLQNKGFLNAQVENHLISKKRGEIQLKIDIKEGDIYLFGGFQFTGNYKECFTDTNEFIKELGIPLGVPFQPFYLYQAIDKIREVCQKKHFIATYVYIENRTITQRSIYSFIFENFRYKPFFPLDLLSRYLNYVLLSPFSGIKFLLKKNPTVIYQIRVEPQLKYKIEAKGNKYFSLETLEKYFLEFFRETNSLKAKEFAHFLREKYQKEGFLNTTVLATSQTVGNEIFYYLSIKEGKRKKKKKTPPLPKKHLSSIKPIVKVICDDKSLEKNIEELIAENTKNINLQLIENFLQKAGCIKPSAKILQQSIKGNKKIIKIKAFCGGRKKIKNYIYWVEGRIKKKEIQYMLPPFKNKAYQSLYKELLKEKLASGELFEDITIKPLFINNETYFLVNLKERRPISLVWQVGYSTDEYQILRTQINLYDPFGYGNILKSSFYYTGKRRDYKIDLYDNYFFSRKYFLGLSLYQLWQTHSQYELQPSKGFSLLMGLHKDLYTDVSLSYSYSVNYITDSPTGENYVNLKKIILDINYSHPIYEGEFKKGKFELNFNIQKALKNYSFWKSELKTGFYKFYKKFIFSTVIKFGKILSGSAPINEKFFLGGMKDLKGYSYESVAPLGGGTVYWFLNTEIGFPFLKKKNIYVFPGLDLGNCNNKVNKVFSKIKKDIYIGIGTITKVGPIRFTLAMPLENKISLSSFKFFFLLGFSW